MPQPTPFGRYLRRHRVAAGISLRAAARKLGISAVYLSEVERGVRRSLPPKYWPELQEIIPTLTHADLDDRDQVSKPITFDVSARSPRTQRAAVALARRFSQGDLDHETLNKMLSAIGLDGDEDDW